MLRLEIITLRFRNITLASIIIILSFTNIALCSSNIFNNSNVSALDYSSNVGIGFTFNPTLSISLSSSDLIIDNLKPGTVEDSNSINVSVATNAAYGYTLSATVGDSLHNNSDLIHTNNTNIFSSVATDADLPSLTTDNTWGYNTSLDSGSTWSNYNGLSNSSNTTLLDKDSNISSSIDFRIGAKASPVQPSGTYTNTITFTAVTKPTPITLSEAYASEGKTMINGYYTMQDMTSTICEKTEAIGAQLQVLDIRDNKLYWISKLADNHCWMTQNLDLDLDSNRTYTHWDTDLGWTTMDEGAEWKPERSTINFGGTTVDGWINNYTRPYSANPGNIYYYTSNSDADDIRYNSLQECISAGHDDCAHYHAGNYYNWSAAVASNNTTASIEPQSNANNSICSKNWRLPQNNPANDFDNIFIVYNIKSSNVSDVQLAPIYLAKSGDIDGKLNARQGTRGGYWTSTIYNNNGAYRPVFQPRSFSTFSYGWRGYGFSVRCLAR